MILRYPKLNKMDVQAAAISLQGQNFIIVLVGMDMVPSSGETDMAIDSLQPKFGNAQEDLLNLNIITLGSGSSTLVFSL